MRARGRDIQSHSGCSDNDEIEKASNTTTVLIVTKRAFEIHKDSKTDQTRPRATTALRNANAKPRALYSKALQPTDHGSLPPRPYHHGWGGRRNSRSRPLGAERLWETGGGACCWGLESKTLHGLGHRVQKPSMLKPEPGLELRAWVLGLGFSVFSKVTGGSPEMHACMLAYNGKHTFEPVPREYRLSCPSPWGVFWGHACIDHQSAATHHLPPRTSTVTSALRPYCIAIDRKGTLNPQILKP